MGPVVFDAACEVVAKLVSVSVSIMVRVYTLATWVDVTTGADVDKAIAGLDVAGAGKRVLLTVSGGSESGAVPGNKEVSTELIALPVVVGMPRGVGAARVAMRVLLTAPWEN